MVEPRKLEGAWVANAARLTEILGDYELVSKLASTYGRIEELRWRLRQRTSDLEIAPAVANGIARMSKPIIDELVEKLADLLKRVTEQIEHPNIMVQRDTVQPAIEIDATGSIVASVTRVTGGAGRASRTSDRG